MNSIAMIVSPQRDDIDLVRYPHGRPLNFYGWLPDKADELSDDTLTWAANQSRFPTRIVREKNRVVVELTTRIASDQDMQNARTELINVIGEMGYMSTLY